jgi:uncharacterized protein (DUF433 family)
VAPVVTGFEEVVRNIEMYVASLAEYPRLAERIKQHPAWYAVKDAAGRWIFGPSKFVGYRDTDPAGYLSGYRRQDGRETEDALKEWFAQVDLDSALGRDLRAAFLDFAEAYGKTAHANWRVSVPSEMLLPRRAAQPWEGRIAFDPDIVHGRARIRGTRVRVIDILAALAAGDTPDEIVAALPYISHADIQAALQYAVASLDHRVLMAA